MKNKNLNLLQRIQEQLESIKIKQFDIEAVKRINHFDQLRKSIKKVCIDFHSAQKQVEETNEFDLP